MTPQNTIPIDERKLRELRDYALLHGTIDKWSEVALQYAEQAAAEIARLHSELQQKR